MTIILSVVAFCFAVVTLFLLWRVFFLRDPRRIPPIGPYVLSPADGGIIYIKRVEKGDIIISRKKHRIVNWSDIVKLDSPTTMSGYLIGIGMTPISAHRNRIPLAGKITKEIYKPVEKNQSLLVMMTKLMLHLPFAEKDLQAVQKNETLTLEISVKSFKYYVTQIAGDMIDRIVVWVRENQKVQSGEQYGLIRFGSQCDLFLPDELCKSIKVKLGDYVYAGESIIAEF